MGVRLDDRRRTWSLQYGWEEKQASLKAEDEQSWREQQKLQAELDKSINEMFAYWDRDGNGLIDRAEFRLVMQVLAIPGSDADHDATFDKWDVDGSGALNFKEIRAALTALQKAQPGVMESARVTVELLS